MYAMTAAHKTLPLSSYVEVTNLKNNRTVIVRINDRGPFNSSRAMDLSYAAAKELGISGTGSVEIKPLASIQLSRKANKRG
jgi:rare lipoprotein A